MFRHKLAVAVASVILIGTVSASATSAGVETITTSHWVTYSCFSAASCSRTTPQNADYTANDCAAYGLVSCGEWIWAGDGAQWAADCAGQGQTASSVATAIRYWADRARANGPGWRVYTWTEGGGYPYRCQFSVWQLY